MLDREPMTECKCAHPLDCRCACHGRYCDPAERTCDHDFLPDEGGLTPWGCAGCTPGLGAPHVMACSFVAAVTVTGHRDQRWHRHLAG